jgi:hypothetical protein
LLKEALSSDIGKDYHNPADVEVLKKAKEVLNALDIRAGLLSDKHSWINKALITIDKALGGDTL